MAGCPSMDTSGWIGLGLQLLGTAVTALALVRDYSDKPDVEPPGRRERWPLRENPWGQPASEVIDARGFDRWFRSQGGYRDGVNIQGVGEAIEEGFEIYRAAAAKRLAAPGRPG